MKINTSHWINQSEISEYLHDVRKHEPLSREDELEILKMIDAGHNEYKEKLVYANLRFVISIAKQYQKQGLTLSDLISEGNFGLLKAVELFDYSKTDIRFLSYAVWWIRQSITKALNDHSRTIRIPSNRISELYKESKKTVGEDDIVLTEESLVSIQRLDSEINEEGQTLYDVISDPHAIKPDEELDNNKINIFSALRRMLNHLNETEQIVILKYFGVDGEEKTLQEISEILGLTKERVRQIKEKAIKKLRFHSVELFDLL